MGDVCICWWKTFKAVWTDPGISACVARVKGYMSCVDGSVSLVHCHGLPSIVGPIIQLTSTLTLYMYAFLKLLELAVAKRVVRIFPLLDIQFVVYFQHV